MNVSWWYTYVPYTVKLSNTTFHLYSVFATSLPFLQWTSLTFISHAADRLHFLWGELRVIKDISVTWSLTEVSLPKRLIGVFETVYEADQSPALRLGTHWKEVILDPSVVTLFYTVSHLTLSHDLVGSGGMRWHSWLRHCAARWKDAGSIPDGSFGLFHWHKPSRCTMALGLNHPLTEMSIWDISWGG